MSHNATLPQTQSNMTVESAYDEAVEGLGIPIYEASRPSFASNGNDSRHSEKHGNSDEICATDSFLDEDDLESNIKFLEEKKLILKKAKLKRKKEEAYIALNAYVIANGQNPSSRCDEASSIWSKARALADEYKIGGRGEDDEENSLELATSKVKSKRTRDDSSNSVPGTYVNKIYQTRKRLKIDLSTVNHINSTEFAKTYGNEEGAAKIENRGIYHNCISSTARLQLVREMQLAIDSRNWISQAVLKQILASTNIALSAYRRSKGE